MSATSQPPTTPAGVHSPVTPAGIPSRTGWESVSRMFEDIALRTRERT